MPSPFLYRTVLTTFGPPITSIPAPCARGVARFSGSRSCSAEPALVQGAIIEAGEVAMAAGWIEREAIRVRRGSHDVQTAATHGTGGQFGSGQLVAIGPHQAM